MDLDAPVGDALDRVLDRVAFAARFRLRVALTEPFTTLPRAVGRLPGLGLVIDITAHVMYHRVAKTLLTTDVPVEHHQRPRHRQGGAEGDQRQRQPGQRRPEQQYAAAIQ